MHKKTLVIINEPFFEMVLGKNTTLSYIAAALDLKHITYIYNLPKEVQNFPSSSDAIEHIIQINPESNLAKKIIFKYREKNQILKNTIITAIEQRDWTLLQKLPNETIGNLIESELLASDIVKTSIKIKEFTNVIQRLEPMKAPFPPQGNANLTQILHQIKEAFPKLSFNCPIYYDEKNLPHLLIDKETPQKINKIGQSKTFQLRKQKLIATPTQEFEIGNSVATKFDEMSEKYLELFPEKNNPKIVLKPKDSAQSLGVFSLEFCNDTDAYDLKKLQNTTYQSLQEQQLYKIKSTLPNEELKEITEILLYIESFKSTELPKRENLKIADISKEEQIKIAKTLYNSKILIQPFLEGVKFGDIRANVAKNSSGNFELLGITFRRSNRINDDKFTTCLTSSGSSAFPISFLTLSEQKNLNEVLQTVLNILNDPQFDLKNYYKNTTELGVDFLLQGNGCDVFLGEINHMCPALAPISEIMNELTNSKFVNPKFKYDGGLKLAKDLISYQIQQKKLSTCN